MDAATVQTKIYKGYKKAAQHIGFPFVQYRPAAALTPLAASLQTLPASFAPTDTYLKAAPYGKPVVQCLVDGTQTRVGDYLVGAEATYFISSMQPLLPIMAVKCNRTVSVFRPAGTTSSVGAQPYGGNTAAGETAIMTGWPCSILQGSKGEKSDVNLPGDARSPWWTILMPHFAGVQIESYDAITDDLDNRYIISSAELTDMGWRITASFAVP